MTRHPDLDVVTTDGPYRIQKDGPRGGRPHVSFSAAEAEALRLSAGQPEATFVITREIARVTRAARNR